MFPDFNFKEVLSQAKSSVDKMDVLADKLDTLIELISEQNEILRRQSEGKYTGPRL